MPSGSILFKDSASREQYKKSWLFFIAEAPPILLKDSASRFLRVAILSKDSASRFLRVAILSKDSASRFLRVAILSKDTKASAAYLQYNLKNYIY